MTRGAQAPAPQTLDLERWWPDLRALVLARYADWIRRERLDLEDVLAEVGLRLAASRVVFDPDLCSIPVFLLMHARSAIGDLARKEKRWRFAALEDAPPRACTSEPWTTPGALDSAVELVLEASPDLDVNDWPAVRLYLEGHTRREISDLLGLELREVKATITAIRATQQAPRDG